VVGVLFKRMPEENPPRQPDRLTNGLESVELVADSVKLRLRSEVPQNKVVCR